MVLSTALFDRPAFKNLICNGLVLAADGKKMSKSLKNYPDPNDVINKYGADALRLYLINSPVVRAEPLRFKEDGVFAVLKDVFLPWYNAYRFLIQNVSRPEVESNITFSPEFDRSKLDNPLDNWILAESSSLVGFIKREMREYRLYTVAFHDWYSLLDSLRIFMSDTIGVVSRATTQIRSGHLRHFTMCC